MDQPAGPPFAKRDAALRRAGLGEAAIVPWDLEFDAVDLDEWCDFFFLNVDLERLVHISRLEQGGDRARRHAFLDTPNRIAVVHPRILDRAKSLRTEVIPPERVTAAICGAELMRRAFGIDVLDCPRRQ